MIGMAKTKERKFFKKTKMKTLLNSKYSNLILEKIQGVQYKLQISKEK